MRKSLAFRDLATFGVDAPLQPDVAGRPKVQEFLIRILDALGEWQERSAQRRRLAAFDNRMLSDIGIDRATAAAEAGKPFWRS